MMYLHLVIVCLPMCATLKYEFCNIPKNRPTRRCCGKYILAIVTSNNKTLAREIPTNIHIPIYAYVNAFLDTKKCKLKYGPQHVIFTCAFMQCSYDATHHTIAYYSSREISL